MQGTIYHSDEFREAIRILKYHPVTVDVFLSMDSGRLPANGKDFARYRRSDLAIILKIGRFRKCREPLQNKRS